MSWSEAKWVVDQLLQKTGQAPNNMRAFAVFATSKTSLALRFQEPADSYDAAGNLMCSVGGVMVRMSTEGYPKSVNDGDLVINNTNLGAYASTPYEVTGLTAGTTYYFAAFPYSSQGVFNLSSSGANRAECVPADGEQAKVTISIDDIGGFTSAVITCVDETDSTATQTATLTPSKLTHTFTVPIGDTYHIEYGAVTDYFKPNNTAAKVSVAGAVTEYTGEYFYFTSTIVVNYPTGSELTCTCGDVSYQATSTTGTYRFKVHKAGSWVLRATNGSEVAESTVVISDTGETKNVTLAYFTATIAVTYPEGATLTCSSGGKVYTADTTTGSYTFEVHQTGTWTIKAVSGDEMVQTTVTISADGEAKTATLAFFRSTIAVTYPAGSTLTCVCGEDTLTAETTSGSYTFTVRKAGTWVVKATNGSETAESSVVISASGQNKSVSLSYFTATINVVYPQGCTLTCSGNNKTLTASTNIGTYQFTVHQAGTWTVKISDGTQETEKAVNITADGQSVNVTLAFVKIYGISRTVGNSSVSWARTDDAAGMTATASVGTVAGHSDFDDCYPWSDMQRETLSTGDVMVKIPEFWYQRKIDSGVEHIRIADKAVDGFAKHPGSGLYVGAYKTSSDKKSVKNAAPTVNQTRATMRTNAKSKGAGWGLIDAAANSAIQMLFMVEFATNDGQAAIGRGYCDGNSAAINSGSCDTVPNLTGRPAGTDGKVDVVYRGIEGIWGNIFEWMDGLNYNGDTDNYYVCTDPSKYADDTATGYTKLNYTSPASNNYITKEGLDNSVPWAMCPSEATGGSETTHYPDYFYQNAGWRVASLSGFWSDGSACGPFYLVCSAASSITNSHRGSRLLYRPS